MAKAHVPQERMDRANGGFTARPALAPAMIERAIAAAPYCLDLIGAAWIETNPARAQALRPKGR